MVTLPRSSKVWCPWYDKHLFYLPYMYTQGSWDCYHLYLLKMGLHLFVLLQWEINEYLKSSFLLFNCTPPLYHEENAVWHWNSLFDETCLSVTPAFSSRKSEPESFWVVYSLEKDKGDDPWNIWLQSHKRLGKESHDIIYRVKSHQ